MNDPYKLNSLSSPKDPRISILNFGIDLWSLASTKLPPIISLTTPEMQGKPD